jgi:PAS domain-containing protein
MQKTRGHPEQLEERIKELEHQIEIHEKISNGIDEGILLLDKDFKILKANKPLLDSLGLKEGDVIGDYWLPITLMSPVNLLWIYALLRRSSKQAGLLLKRTSILTEMAMKDMLKLLHIR